ncbi:9311_t:CDS:2, partial [Gigaspora rosea]
ERLLKNPMIVHITDCGLQATCKCGKVIKLKRAYDEAYFKSHIDGNGCKLQNDRPIYKAYINRVFTHTTHGGAPRREVIARELFPEKFSSDKAVKYKLLSENELQLLDSEIIRQSKWKIEGLVVQFVLCEQYTTNSSQLCDYCKEIQDDQIFKNVVSKQDIPNSKKKFMPKIQLRSNPIVKYIYNQDVCDLLYLANNNNTNNENSFWIKFAEMGRNGGFSNRKVFEGLCNIMVQITDREQRNKGLQNLKYSDQFSDFIVILASLSPQAYNVFRQNLAGLYCACLPYALHDPELCFENIARVKRLVDTIKYAGPIITMFDNTKIKERLGYSSIFGCIVGSVLSTESTKVSTYEDVHQI